MSLISVRRTPEPTLAAYRRAVDAHFAALGVEGDLRPGLRVLLKPNLLAARRPDQAVTTHPALVQAAADWFRERGVADIVVADSPGGPYAAARLRQVYAACGMDGVSGASLNLSTDWAMAEQPRGRVCRRFPIIRPALEDRYIVNLPKVKTHGMTGVSLGIKNLFGLVPGLDKPALHCRCPGWEEFAGMLLDLADLVRPQVTLVDGVLAMEGDGPSGGTPRELNYTFAARDLYTLDWFLCGRVMGIPPEETPMLRQALERGWVEKDPKTAGDALGTNRPFRRPVSQSADFADRLPAPLRAPAKAAMGALFRPRPRVLAGRCVGCGICAQSCPQHIIRVEGGRAVIGPRGCISCFCCQELCPEKAIAVRGRGGVRL